MEEKINSINVELAVVETKTGLFRSLNKSQIEEVLKTLDADVI